MIKMTTKINIKDLKILENGNYVVETKDGSFELEDCSSEALENAKNRNKGSEIYGILSALIVAKDGQKQRIGELTLKKYKASTILKLQVASEKVLGGEDFLLEDSNSSQTQTQENNI